MKLIKKPKSKFYWYDFTVRGRRYRASTQETRSVKALTIASLKLASIIENTDPLPSHTTSLGDFAERFLDWVDTARLEEMTGKSYRNGWRLLKSTPVVQMRVNQLAGAGESRGRSAWTSLLAGWPKPEAIRKRVDECGRISNDKSLEVMAMAPRVPRVSQALWEVARWSELGPLF